MEAKQSKQYSNIVEFKEDETTLFTVTNQRMGDEIFKKQVAVLNAANDLLSALESMHYQFEFWKTQNPESNGFRWAEKALSAIKKAKGE